MNPTFLINSQTQPGKMIYCLQKQSYQNSYLQIASTRLAEVLSPDDKGARNSLLLYFAIINLSLSSCEEEGAGFSPFDLCSQMLFASVLPRKKNKT